MSSDSFLKWMKIEDEFVQRDGFPLPLHSNLVGLKFFHFSLWQQTRIAHNKHFQYQFGQSELNTSRQQSCILKETFDLSTTAIAGIAGLDNERKKAIFSFKLLNFLRESL